MYESYRPDPQFAKDYEAWKAGEIVARLDRIEKKLDEIMKVWEWEEMKYIAIVLLALLVAPCIASEDTNAAYMEGLNAGYTFGYLAIQGQTNATAEALYNHRVSELNAWMDQVGYDGPKWGELPIIQNYELPRIFADPSDWYKTEA